MENLILSPIEYAKFNLKKAYLNERIATIEYEILNNTMKRDELKKEYNEKYSVIPIVRKETSNG